jgi:signal transduction histidine kinase
MTTTEADRTFLAGLTVLYVEDSRVIRDMTAEFLRRRVGRLCLAEDGVEGVEAFRRERPHLLVTDIMMPRMDGLAMAETIKVEAPDLPVVVITAFEQSQFLLRAIALGVDRYVLKPVQPDLLEAALLHCAHQLRAEEELRQHLKVERELLKARHTESLSILAQGMAHDYNNLVQAILSSVETAVGHLPPGSPAHLILGMSQRFAGQAQQLGKQLLALGQANDLLDRQGPLDAVIDGALLAALEGSGLKVALLLPADLPPVRYNHERLVQALTILMTNAKDAMPRGGTLDIQASVREVRAGEADLTLGLGTYLRLSLKDSGVGIPADLLPHIFEPYQSGKERGAKKGQGLSLSICRAILLAHGGQVTVESQVGQGSTFHVFLPVQVSEA